MWARAGRLRELSILAWRELLLACAWQLRLRLILLADREVVARLTSCIARRRPVVAAPLDPIQIERVVRWSGVICGGSCLTNAFVHAIIAARHGLERPVTIGVNLEGRLLRAHAWAGHDDGAGAFTSLWTLRPGRRP